jgi:hypothetical protein
MAERRVVAPEAPVQLRSVTPSGIADVGESGPAVTRSLVLRGFESLCQRRLKTEQVATVEN